MTSSLNRGETVFFACLEGGTTVTCLRHTLSTECALAAFYADF